MVQIIDKKLLPKILTGEKNKFESNVGELIFKGIPSSPGLAMGKAYVLKPDNVVVRPKKIPQDKIPNEVERFDSALQVMVKDITDALEKVKGESPNVVAILETNLMILNDEIIINSVKERIFKGISAESAVIQEYDQQEQFIKKSKDNILKERSFELEHLKERLLATLRNKVISYTIPEGSIVIAQSITPTDVVNFKDAKVLGIITEAGGIASHSSILARSFEIPSVIGIKDLTWFINNHEKVIIDGYAGIVTVNPPDSSIETYKTKKAKEEDHKRELGELVKLPAETLDGSQIKIMANIDFPEEIEAAVIAGCEGVGLVRTENLVISLKSFPDEEVQYKWYNEITERAYPNPVILRAFDVGSDKYAEGMPMLEKNPALGFRGIRFLLHRDDIFRKQIRALLRASRNKNLKIMLPMISSVNEVEDSFKIIQECKKELEGNSIPFDNDVPVGIMIETPAAAFMADRFAKLVNFFSIGTNDLTQYTLAADRSNEMVTDIYDTFHPAVLNLIKNVIDVAKSNKIPVSVCGELAGNAAATGLLVGLGIEELSVTPPMILELKKRIREMKFKKAKKLAKEILECNSYIEVCKKLAIF